MLLIKKKLSIPTVILRERDSYHFPFFLDVLSMIGYMGLCGAVVSAFDGQGDSSCGFA